MGGQGPTSRMWGYTIDAVREVEVVTADGEIVRASETQHADLFWVRPLPSNSDFANLIL
jgi:FAD/FMN-containing dehydrogenase